MDTIRPLSDIGSMPEQHVPTAAKADSKLWVKLKSRDDPVMQRIELILTMFPGQQQMVIYCAREKRKLTARCIIHDSLVAELKEMLGEENVVVK